MRLNAVLKSFMKERGIGAIQRHVPESNQGSVRLALWGPKAAMRSVGSAFTRSSMSLTVTRPPGPVRRSKHLPAEEGAGIPTRRGRDRRSNRVAAPGLHV